MDSINLNRRQFIVTTATLTGGLLLGIAPARAGTAQLPPWSQDASATREVNAWVEIAADNTVTIRVPTPEIGNGAMTQVAMNVTEELECDWDLVKVEFCSVHRSHGEGNVYQSGFLPFFGGHGTDKVRMTYAMQMGASARERLKAAAAARWNAPITEIEAKKSRLTHTPTGRTLTFGEVAAEAAAVTLTAEPALKSPSDWTFIGKASPAKKHIPAIVTGKAVFGIDVQVPGMVHAALKQSPVHGGKLKSHQPEAVLNMPGVRAVVVLDAAKTKGSPVPQQSTWGFATNQTQSAVAVIADHYWQAKMALDQLPVEWEPGEGAQWADTEQIYAAARALLDKDSGTVLRQSGDVKAVTADKTVEASYSTPYSENAMMEPLNGTALVSADSAEVWCPAQDMMQAWWVAIDETGLKPEQVKFHQTYVGGRFGRSTQADDTRMVVAVAKEYPGVPVKTIWSREECFTQGRYRTPISTRFAAKLGSDGYPQAITGRTVFVGTSPLFQLTLGFDDQPYFTSGIISNVHLSRDNFPINIQNGAYRAPCYNSHVFMVETFIDECAAAAGIDPLDYRLHLLANWDKSWSDCLRLAAAKAGWGKPLPKGEGLGIAISNWPAAGKRNAGTVVATAARVAVSPQGEVKVKQVDVAFDCGRVANADAVRAQIEGATLFGINMTLNEQLTVKNGVIAETNFHQYPMQRMADAPVVNVHFDALSGQERFEIVGEAPIGPVGPAIGNAVYRAIGERVRSTPVGNWDLGGRESLL